MEDVGFTAENAPVVIDHTNAATVTPGNGYNYSPITPLFVPYMTAYMYLEQLSDLAASGDKIAAAINPTAMWQFAIDEFFHVKEESAYGLASYYIGTKWDPTDSDLDKAPAVAQGDFVYDKAATEEAIKIGIQYALDNQDNKDIWLTGAYRPSEPAYALAQMVVTGGYSSFKEILEAANGDYTNLSYQHENNLEYSERDVTALVAYYGVDGLSELVDLYVERMDRHPWNPDTTVEGTYGYGLKTSSTGGTAVSFTDVPAGSFYEDAVQWAVSKGITGGTSTTANTFSPERTCTHAEIITFLYRAAGSAAVPAGTANPFANISAGDYYYDAALWAYAKGIVTADFKPDQGCTRADAVNYLYLYAGKPSVSAQNTFTDVTDAALVPAVNWAVVEGITQGSSATANTFSPERICMRSEIVTYLYRAFA